MKKLLKEFKEFAMRGNVIDMAIGVIIGAAFGKVVTAVIDIFLTPILEALPKMENGGTGFAGSLISFCAVLVEFILTALVLFLILKAVNKAMSLRKKPAEAPKAEAAPAAEVKPRDDGKPVQDPSKCVYCTICARKCPAGALTVDRAAKTWTLDEDLCVGCGTCAEACPKKCILI